MRRVVPLSALTVCFVLNACGVDDPDVQLPNLVRATIADMSVARARNAVLELGLSAVGEQTQDRIVVRATVKNTSANPVAWDREFAAHVRWSVVDDDGLPLVRERFKSAEPPQSWGRFVILKPGESISKEIELKDRVQMFRIGSMRASRRLSNGALGCVTNATYYEEVSKFSVFDRCKRGTVSWEYSIQWAAMQAAERSLGEGHRSLPFCRDSLQSNPLTVSLAKRPAAGGGAKR